MIGLPPRSTRTDTLFPYTTLFRSTGVMTKPIRIGQIVPSSNVTMETEIPALLRAREQVAPERFTFHRSEEHTSELQSLMRISYAGFCLKKKVERRTKGSSSTSDTYTSEIHSTNYVYCIHLAI